MGRSSSSGLPYLVLRPDAGKYAYWRRLQLDVAPFVIGDISLVWLATTRPLTGAPLIKISLKTGDDATARLRWAQIHPQVEALVQMAQLRVNDAKTREAARQRVAALSPEAISTMAGQVKHDILAEHDRPWVDPSFSSPLTGIVASLMHKAGAAANEDTQDAARRFGQDVLAREARRALRRPGSDGLDSRIQDGEIGPVPSIIDIDALQSGRIKTLTPEQMDALCAHEPLTDMPNAIDKILADNGIDVPRDHPDRRKLALSIMRAAANAYDIIDKRERGAGIDTPPRPPSMAPAESPVPVVNTSPTLMAVRARWIALKRPQQKQVDDNLLYIQRFIDVHGDLPIDTISRAQIRNFRDLLLQCPRNVPKHLSKSTLNEQIAWASQDPTIPRLSRRTINAKGLGSLSALMVVAISEEIINQNPCSNMLLPLRNADIVERVAYNNADLQNIFRSPVYQTPPKRPIGGAGEAAHWLPLCGLYTGARLEELGQLAVSDIKLEDGITYFDITDIPDDDESLRSEPEVDVNERLSEIHNSVKSPAGRRRVPMHTQLVRLGFVEYIEQQRAAGVQQLFPQLQSYKNRYTKNWSRWWGRYSDRHVTSDETKTFHSFRHTVIRRLRDLRVPEQVAKALVGHAARDTTSLYGRGFDLTTLNEEIQKLCYPALDLSHLYRDAYGRPN